MTSFMTLIYCLPPEFIAQCLLLGSLVFLLARRRFGDRGWFRRGLWLCLLLWFAAAFWTTLLDRAPGIPIEPELIPLHSYRELLAGGLREILRTNFMNIALFYPAGLLTASLIPERCPEWKRMLLTGALFSLMSVGIEVLQYRLVLGHPEIDDVIHNTLGAVLGVLPVAFREILCGSASD